MTVLAGIRARLEAATPGPWVLMNPTAAMGIFGARTEADAEFIAHAPEDVGLLLAVAEAADRFLDLDYGYLSQATKEGVEPLRVALARLAGGTHEGDTA